MISNRELNRWTLARQHLLARAEGMSIADMIESLAGMQAQHPPAPYVGLWTRLEGFERAHLEDALDAGEVLKTTVMRGTLHLLPTRRLAAFRIATGSNYYEAASRDLERQGIDLLAIRRAVLAAVADRPHTRREILELIAGVMGDQHRELLDARPYGIAAVSVATDLVNMPSDASFDHWGASHYQVAPPVAAVDPADAHRIIAAAYLGAYGPASRSDLSAWSGKPASAFAEALAALDVVEIKSDDGRALFDLADAPRPPADIPAPVRFLPKWDSLLLAHVRRERVFPEGTRDVVIRKNGDVLPTFLVDGMVAGSWNVPRRGPAVVSLTPLTRITVRNRKAVEAEGRRLLRWLRPESTALDLEWSGE